MKHIIYILFILTITINSSFGQSQLKSKFIDAEYYFLFDEYSKALPLYLSILQKDSNNANINYRIALCYLNLVGQKHKSIPYLEKATKDVTNTYKEGSYKELRAPFEAYLYLGDAYRINEELDKAINAYKKFQSLLAPEDVYFNQIATRQIKSCNNAKEMFFTPVEVEEFNIGDPINTMGFEYNPCVSQNEDFMFFSLSKMNEIVLYSKKVNGVWEKPKNVSNLLKTEGLCKAVSLSHDGKQLFLTDDGPENNGDIYVAKVGKSKPGEMEKLNKNINTRFSETHACISPDGKTLYFTSDRKGGYGGIDIYKSIKSQGEWGPAINLGPTINTPYNDETPFITADGKSLYFSSEGHNSIGGYDFFVSTMLSDGNWSVPLNLGYPISTTDDDLFYFPIKNGETAYTSRIKNFGDALSDIYYIKPGITKLPENISFNGTISYMDNNEESIYNTKIYFVNDITKDTIKVITPDTITYEYNTKVPIANYEILFTSNNYHIIKEKYIIPNILTRIDVNFNIEFVPSILASNFIKNDSTTNSSLKNYQIENIDTNLVIAFNNDTLNNIDNNNASIINNDSTLLSQNNLNSNNTNTNTNTQTSNNSNLINTTSTSANISSSNSNSNNVTNTSSNILKTDNVKNELYVIKSVYFDYASFQLNNKSKSEVEKLYMLMKANPNLTVDLIGNTDSKGNPEYNQKLSERRANSVELYLKSKGINSSRINTKGLGESNNIAINQNPDGSDNPDGRQLNRRVDINIINPGNANVVVEDIYVPDNLKVNESTLFYVLLLTNNKLLPQSEFINKNKSEFLNPNVYKKNNTYYYLVGNFKNKSNALPLLNEAIDAGFEAAKIINSFELSDLQKIESGYTNQQKNISITPANSDNYTIQIKALSKRVDESEFKIENIIVTECIDGLFRYTVGNFSNYDEAREYKIKIDQLGYEDSFILKVSDLQNKAGKLEIKDLKDKSENKNTESETGQYTIQIKALNTPVGIEYFKDLDEIKENFCKDGYIRYTMGTYNNFSVARFDLEKIKEIGYNDAFIVDFTTLNPVEKSTFSGITSTTYTIQVKASTNKLDNSELGNLENVKEFIGKDGFHRYTVGEFPTYNEAKTEWEKIIINGFPDAFIVNISSYENK